MSVDPDRVVKILGGERVLGRRVRNLAELREAVEAGLPVAALDRVARRVAEPGAAVSSVKYGVVSKASLSRRRTRLSPAESERLERLARVAAMAEQVWENTLQMHEFLNSPQPQLGGERPVDLARTDLGAREVEALLMKLEYALPA
jgi:putative toxin-antitoxin system antitoxin component (TIGR02293 family)